MKDKSLTSGNSDAPWDKSSKSASSENSQLCVRHTVMLSQCYTFAILWCKIEVI